MRGHFFLFTSHASASTSCLINKHRPKQKKTKQAIKHLMPNTQSITEKLYIEHLSSPLPPLRSDTPSEAIPRYQVSNIEI